MPAGTGFGLSSTPILVYISRRAFMVSTRTCLFGGLNTERELDRLAITGTGAYAISACLVAGGIQKLVGLGCIIWIRRQVGVVPEGVRPQRGRHGGLSIQQCLDDRVAVGGKHEGLADVDILERAEAG